MKCNDRNCVSAKTKESGVAKARQPRISLHQIEKDDGDRDDHDASPERDEKRILLPARDQGTQQHHKNQKATIRPA